MTVFKDRLPNSIGIKRRFVPSQERIIAARNGTIGLIMLLLTLALLLKLFDWLAS